MQRKPLIAANWKMNEPPVGCCAEGSPYRERSDIDVWVFPSFIDLHSTRDHGLLTGAQCGHPKESGAFTGDISMLMLAHQKFISVLCGHSERRLHHKETDAFVAEQVIEAMNVGLQPILCVGESADERANGDAKNVVATQVQAVINNSLPREASVEAKWGQFVIAYEPIWAIGSGKTATPSDAQDMHAFIRSLLPKEIADAVRIVYGGSVKPENAAEILKQPDIDGALVGGASLNPDSFRKIIDSLPA